MSRSTKHFPAHGHTTAVSDKEDKVLAHRIYRRKAMASFRRDGEIPKDVRNGSWKFAKDGRSIFDPMKHPELMRK